HHHNTPHSVSSQALLIDSVQFSIRPVNQTKIKNTRKKKKN
ncbi:MAG: hypothetical protein ACI90V_011970, partial [Bacillariaceae sp.]